MFSALANIFVKWSKHHSSIYYSLGINSIGLKKPSNQCKKTNKKSNKTGNLLRLLPNGDMLVQILTKLFKLVLIAI